MSKLIWMGFHKIQQIRNLKNMLPAEQQVSPSCMPVNVFVSENSAESVQQSEKMKSKSYSNKQGF